MVDRLISLSDFLDRQVGRILIALMAAEIVVVFSAVIARYVFNNSFTWSDEVSRAFLTWIIFLGASSACRNGELLGITVFQQMLPRLGRRLLLAFVTILMIVFLVWTIDLAIDLMARTSRQSTFVLRVPLNWVTAAIPVGFALMILHLSVHLVRIWRGEEDQLTTDHIAEL